MTVTVNVAAAEPPVRPPAPRRLLMVGAGFLVLAAVVAPLAALVRGRWQPLVDLDAAAARGATSLSGLHGAASVLTWLGAPVVLEAVATVLALWLLRAGRGRSALYLALAVGGGQLLSVVAKAAVHRARPCVGRAVALHCPHSYSFPSGHALAAAGGYLALAVVTVGLVGPRSRRLVTGVAVGLPLLVAATRVVLGVHYLTDVLAGLALGWGWVALCTGLLARWRAEEDRPMGLRGSERE